MQNEKKSGAQVGGLSGKSSHRNTDHAGSYKSGGLLSLGIGMALCFVTYLFACYGTGAGIWHNNKKPLNRPGKDVSTSTTGKKQEAIRPRFETSESVSAIPFNNKMAVGDSYTAAN
jgi:hypothetical protein